MAVATTAIGGIPREYTNGEVYLVEPGNVAELIEGFEEILSNRERRKIQVERGKARIHQWREYNSAGHQHGEILANRNKGR